MAQLQEHAGLTARAIIQNFQNLLSAGRQNDDVRISDRQWLFNLDHHRAQLIRQQVEKGQSLNENLVQSLGAYNEKEKTVELSIPKRSCGRWYSDPIPQPIEVYQSNLITYVGTVSGRIPFQHTTAQKAKWEEYATYTSNTPKWYQLQNAIFLIKPPSPSTNIIAIRGVFENPRAVKVFNKEELDPLDYLNFEYPISTTMLDTLYKMLIEGELKLALAKPYDAVNDSKGDA